MSSSPLSLSAIRTELERRGILSGDTEKSKEQKSIPYDHIVEEMKRRGLITGSSSKGNSILEKLTDLTGPFVRGLGSGIASSALQEAKLHHDAGVIEAGPGIVVPVPYNPFLSKDIGSTIDYLHDTHQNSPVGKAFHKAGEFAGGMLSFPSMGSSSSLVPHLKNSLTVGAPVGAVASAAQQLGVNPIVADIGASIVAPTAAKKISKGIAFPFSPSLRENIYKQKIEKKLGQAVRDITSENPTVSKVAENGGLKGILDPIENNLMSAEEAGRIARNTLAQKLNRLQKRRHDITAPLYDKQKSMGNIVDLTKPYQDLVEEIPNLYGDPKTKLENIVKGLNPDLSPSQVETIKAFNDLSKTNIPPLQLEKIEHQLFGEKGLKGMLSPPLQTPLKTENMLRTLKSQAFAAQNKEGRGDISFKLREAANKIEEEYKKYPQAYEARKKYSELSEPINSLVNNKVVGKILEEGPVPGEYKITDASIPKEIINSSMTSIEKARDFLRLTDRNQEVLQSMKGYINFDLLEHITDSMGNVSPERIRRWAIKNKGAFELYPELKTRLANLSNAKYFTSQLEKKMSKMDLLDAYEFLPWKILKKFGKKLYGVNEAIQLISKINQTQNQSLKQEMIQRVSSDPLFFKAMNTPLSRGNFWNKHAGRLGNLLGAIINDQK